MRVDTSDHSHQWATESTHTTSEGLLRYQWCSCGRWRILLARNAVVLNDVVQIP